MNSSVVRISSAYGPGSGIEVTLCLSCVCKSTTLLRGCHYNVDVAANQRVLSEMLHAYVLCTTQHKVQHKAPLILKVNK